MIAGGGKIGFSLANEIENNYKVKLVIQCRQMFIFNQEFK